MIFQVVASHQKRIQHSIDEGKNLAVRHLWQAVAFVPTLCKIPSRLPLLLATLAQHHEHAVVEQERSPPLQEVQSWTVLPSLIHGRCLELPLVVLHIRHHQLFAALTVFYTS